MPDEEVIETITLPRGIVDAIHNGELYGVDAGERLGWSIDVPQFQHEGLPPENSPTGAYVFRIDLA
jgi:hypothetical protein